MYWYGNFDNIDEIVSPQFRTLKELTDFNKNHRKDSKKTSPLIIDGKEIRVVRCQDKAQGFRGNSRF